MKMRWQIMPLMLLFTLFPWASHAAEPTTAPSTAPAGVMPAELRDAVEKGLKYLAATQAADGSLGRGSKGDTASTSLAMMAFVAAGHQPGKGPYGEAINKGIDFVLASQRDTGLICRYEANGSMYEHGISLVMLSNVFPMADHERQDRIGKALAKGVKLTVDAQKYDNRPKQAFHAGGWRYQPRSPDSDLCVTGWQIAGLCGAAKVGIQVPPETLAAAGDYVRRCSDEKHGDGFGYMPGQGGSSPCRSAIGIISLELLRNADPNGPGVEAPQTLAAAEYLLKNPRIDPGGLYYYYEIYHVTRSMTQLGGKYAAACQNPAIWKSLIALQQPDGSFKDLPQSRDFLGRPVDHGRRVSVESGAGPAYRTAMATLAMCYAYGTR